MKSLIFFMLSLACFGLEATHFQSSTSITPVGNENQFLVEIQIKKIFDDCSIPKLIASPQIICVQGQPAKLRIESEDQADLLFIQVMIPENIPQAGIQTLILLKEKGEVVLSLDNLIRVF